MNLTSARISPGGLALYALLAVLSSSTDTFAQRPNAELSAGIKQLLTENWKSTTTARQNADDRFAQLQPRDNARGDATRAYALVLIKQGRYREALTLLEESFSNDEDDTLVRWTRSWLLLLTQDYAAAAAEIGRSAERLQDDLNKAPQLINLGLVERTGQIVGFLEGPASGKVAVADLSRSIARIEDSLDPKQLEVFQRARQEMLAEFHRRTQQVQRAAEVDRQAAETRRQAELAAAAAERAKLDQALAAVNDRRLAAERTYQSQISQVTQRETEATQTLLSRESEAAAIADLLVLIDADLLQLDALIAVEEDPFRRAALIAQHQDLLRLQHLRANQLAVARQAVFSSRRSVADARQSRLNFEQTHQRDLNRLDQQQTSIISNQRQIDRTLADLANPIPERSVRSRALRGKTKALTTYVRYPLEEARRLTLDRL